MAADRTLFVTFAESAAEARRARLLAQSIRSFGGELAGSAIWVFDADPTGAARALLEGHEGLLLPFEPAGAAGGYLFAAKVAACARAEELAPPEARSLVWINPECLVLRPPLLLDLAPSGGAAFRPVHIRNVGSLTTESPDPFWSGVYEVTGLPVEGTAAEVAVESFVDGQRLRAYFNTHSFAVDPARGLLRRWRKCFEALVGDSGFQSRSCGDPLHRVFLHQAVLSALAGGSIPPARLRILPPEYNYPYNLHASVRPQLRARALDDLVIVVPEDRSLDPDAMGDIEISAPLRAWLAARRDLSA